MSMSPQEYAKFKESLRLTQEKTAKTLASIDSTLLGVQQSLQKIKQNQENIEKFKDDFNKVINKLAENIAASMGANPNSSSNETFKQLPHKDVVKAMLKHKQILIITGAGVSAPSGIPTFRGKNGLYDKKFKWEGQEYDPEEFITKQFYNKHSEAIWEWIEQIYKMAVNLKPNKLHQLIDKLAKVLSARGKNVTIVTQNIDDFHVKPTKEEYKYYAVHGNVKEVRCDNNHVFSFKDFRKEIIQLKKVAKCPKCEQALRPHVLFFDESYGPLYGGEVKEKEFPFVIVIGTSLSTGLCRKLTFKGKEIVQINPNPVLTAGKIYRFKQDTAQTLTKFLKEMGEIK